MNTKIIMKVYKENDLLQVQKKETIGKEKDQDQNKDRIKEIDKKILEKYQDFKMNIKETIGLQIFHLIDKRTIQQMIVQK
jgi:hypothetical protein